MNATVERNKMRVMLGRLLAGAIVGAGATSVFIAFVAEPHMNLDDPGVLLAVVTGVSYVMIGLIVAFGLVAPTAGAKLLNVEDEEELRDESPKLKGSVVGCVLVGAFVLVLAMSGTGPRIILDPQTALLIAGACVAGFLFAGRIGSSRRDEMTRHIALQSSALAFYLSIALIGGWAALSHLGYVAWISPLALLSTLILLQLLAIFAVSARKGLMTR